MRDLENVLLESGAFEAGEVNQVIDTILAETNSKQIGIGIKTVLECIEEAKIEAARGEASSMAESFISRVVGAMGASDVPMDA